MVLHNISSFYFTLTSFSISTSFSLSLFLSIFSIPHSFPLFPFLQVPFCFYLYSCPITSRVFRDIFFSFISFLPSLILEFLLLWVFVLFRLSHMHSMRQRIGGNPLINAEVKTFNLLACFGSLLEVLGTFWKSDMDYLCTLPRVRLNSLLLIAYFTGMIY